MLLGKADFLPPVIELISGREVASLVLRCQGLFGAAFQH
jgi:hypothetical protein